MTSLLGTVTSFVNSYAAFVTLRFFIGAFNMSMYIMVFVLGKSSIVEVRLKVTEGWFSVHPQVSISFSFLQLGLGQGGQLLRIAWREKSKERSTFP